MFKKCQFSPKSFARLFDPTILNFKQFCLINVPLVLNVTYIIFLYYPEYDIENTLDATDHSLGEFKYSGCEFVG